MKLILKLISAFVLFSQISFGQCTPDTTLTGSNFYFAPPNSQYITINGVDYAIMPYAETGVNYDEVLQFKIPSDTTVNSLSATIDYLKVLSISNLPASFQLNCNPSNCTFPGGSFGCVQMTGIGGQADSILLKVVVELQFSNGGNSFTAVDTIKDIILVTQGSMGLENNRNNELLLNTYPNPVNDRMNITFIGNDSETYIRIYSMEGALIFQKRYETNSGKNNIDLDLKDIPSGLYILSIHNGNESSSSQVSVNH